MQTPSRTWPGQFLADFERTGPALWFFLFLLTRMNPQTGYIRTSFRKVSEELAVSTVKIKHWLEVLDQEGYLQDESLDGKLVVHIVII